MGHGQVVFFWACVTCAHLALMHLVSSFISRCLVSEVQAVSVKVHTDSTGKVQTACKCVNSCCSALQCASAAPNGHSWAIQALDSGLVPAILKSAPRIDQLKKHDAIWCSTLLSPNLYQYLIYKSVIHSTARALRKGERLDLDNLGGPIGDAWFAFKHLAQERITLKAKGNQAELGLICSRMQVRLFTEYILVYVLTHL